MNISIIIPDIHNYYSNSRKKKKVRYLDSFIGTNKGWESTFFEVMSCKEEILEKVLNFLYDAKEHLNFSICHRNFTRNIDQKYRSISDSIVLGLNSLPYVNTNPYTEIEHNLLNKISKVQRDVINLYNYYRQSKEIWFS